MKREAGCCYKSVRIRFDLDNLKEPSIESGVPDSYWWKVLTAPIPAMAPGVKLKLRSKNNACHIDLYKQINKSRAYIFK